MVGLLAGVPRERIVQDYTASGMDANASRIEPIMAEHACLGGNSFFTKLGIDAGTRSALLKHLLATSRVDRCE